MAKQQADEEAKAAAQAEAAAKAEDTPGIVQLRLISTIFMMKQALLSTFQV